MDRRNFFRIVSTTSAGALAGGCGSKADKLIPLLVPRLPAKGLNAGLFFLAFPVVAFTRTA